MPFNLRPLKMALGFFFTQLQTVSLHHEHARAIQLFTLFTPINKWKYRSYLIDFLILII
jgi:hypothetical protein